MRLNKLFLCGPILVLASTGGCSRNGGTAAPAAPALPPVAPAAQAAAPATPAGPTASGTVVETMDAAEYTYVRVKTESGDVWAATRQFKVAVGDKVSFSMGMPMANFRSNTLKRTFPTIYFAASIEREAKPGAKK